MIRFDCSLQVHFERLGLHIALKYPGLKTIRFIHIAIVVFMLVVEF